MRLKVGSIVGACLLLLQNWEEERKKTKPATTTKIEYKEITIKKDYVK